MERKPDIVVVIVVVNKKEKIAMIIDVAIPEDNRIIEDRKVSESQKRDSRTLELLENWCGTCDLWGSCEFYKELL